MESATQRASNANMVVMVNLPGAMGPEAEVVSVELMD